MKKLTLIFILFLIVLVSGCSSGDKQLIKKDLDSRYTKFEIVEMKPDSSNVQDAFMTLLSLKVNISQGKLDIIKAGNHYYNVDGTGKWSHEKTTQYMDSITDKLSKMCNEFMYLQFSKPEACYSVKYRIFNGALKEEREEYYYIRVYDEGKQKELMHRPVSWKEYLVEQDCSDIMDQCYEEQLKFLREIVYGN